MQTYEQLTATARQCLTRHDHPSYILDSLTRENCSACVLNGYHPKGESRNDINYAGWARIYVEAGKLILPNLFLAFMAELASDNRSYADCLRDDIKHYGIKAYGKGSDEFIRLVKNVCGIYE